MHRERQLLFADPTPDGFTTLTSSLHAAGYSEVLVAGHNELSVAVAACAERNGLAVKVRDVHSSTEDAQSPPGSRAVILTETDGEKLSAQLLRYIAHTEATIAAPITDWHFSKKPLFIISIPKAGTHLVYELANALGYFAGVELPEFPSGQTWYCLEYSNSHTTAKDFFVDTVRRAPFGNRHHPFPRSPALFIYRHPLDILVSEACYYHRDGKTAYAGYFEGRDFDQRLSGLLGDEWLLGPLRERIGAFLPWLDFPNVIPLSFEELVGAEGGGETAAQLDVIWSIQLKLQVPGRPEHIARRVFNRNSPTFRDGQVGSYANHLAPEAIRAFAETNIDILDKFGYSPQLGSLPRHADALRFRPISYSHVDYERMPLTIENDFLGCNLVRYNRRVYAVPRQAGPIALDQMTPEVLGQLPAASTVSELKSLLLVGAATTSEHREALHRLGCALREEERSFEGSRYWTPSVTPRIVEEYKGFNIVAFRDRYLGLRQALGSVEFDDDISELISRFDPDDLLISTSIVGLKDDIDQFSVSARIGCKLHQSVQGLEKRLTELSDGQLDFSFVQRLADENQQLRSALDGISEQLEHLQRDVATLAQNPLIKFGRTI